MNDPQLAVASEVDLAHRFSVDEEKASEWLGRIVAAYPDEAQDVSEEAPTISAGWNARSDGAERTAGRLVRGAVEDTALSKEPHPAPSQASPPGTGTPTSAPANPASSPIRACAATGGGLP
jgi:hypothetical protein